MPQAIRFYTLRANHLLHWPFYVVILFFSFRLAQIYRVNRKMLPNLLWGIKVVIEIEIQIVLSIFLCLHIAILALWAISADQRALVSIPAAPLSVVAAIGLLGLLSLENNRSIRPSLLICTCVLISMLVDVAQTRTLWLRRDNRALSSLFTCSIIVKLIALCLEAFEKRSFLIEPYNIYPPEALAGVLNRSLFWWLNMLIQKGRRNVLSLGDLYDTDKELSSFLRQNSRHHGTINIPPEDTPYFAILPCFKLPLLTLIFPRLCLIGFRFSQPLLINRAISWIEAIDTPENKDVCYSLIGATALIYIELAISTAQYRHQIYRVNTMIRGGLISIIYDTTLTLDANSIGDSAAVTLMSVDIERIGAGVDSLWAGPIEAGIALYLLQRELGLACLAPAIVSRGKLTMKISAQKTLLA